MTARPLPRHKPRTPSANSMRFRILSAVLAFMCAPFEVSLPLLAGIASVAGFAFLMFAVGTFIAVGDVGNAAISGLGAIPLGLGGFLYFGRFL